MVVHRTGEREKIARLPEGSQEEGWFRAEQDIKSKPLPDGTATAMKG